MIDSEGFRPNVGIVICNKQGQLLWAKRIGQSAWQFPQGGIKAEESLEQALYRELDEEVGSTHDTSGKKYKYPISTCICVDFFSLNFSEKVRDCLIHA